jgi:uncharacterized protein (TIGR03437 family)
LLVTGNNPSSIAAADFNADGRLYLATANRGTGRDVSVLLGTGGGSFAAAANLKAGSLPLFVTTGDVDGNGTADLIVVDNGTLGSAQDPGGIFVLPGAGGGAFAAGVRHEAGLNPTSAAVADLNGDGRLDVAFTASGPGFTFRYGVLLGTGGGAFGPPLVTGTTFGPGHVVIRDFDGDGKQDLAIAYCCGETNWALARGNGDGSFLPEEYFAGGSSPARLLVDDFNTDGRPDVVVVGLGENGTPGTLVVLLNNLAETARLGNLNGASFAVGEAVAPLSVVASFGEGVAPGNAAAPPPTVADELLGTYVAVRDSADAVRPGRLYFVSPNQVGFLLAEGTATGLAAVKLITAEGKVFLGTLNVERVGPGLFQLNGDGLAAATLQRLRGAAQTYEPVFQLVEGAIVPLPIDLGPEGDRVFPTLYGTGIRGRTSFSQVSVTAGGENLPPLYAGDQLVYPGLDQINVELPRSFAGRGLIDIVVRVDGKVTNTVRLVIQ